MKLTPWFNGNTKPVRKGVYQRNYGSKKSEDIFYCLWNGKNWRVWADSVKDASLEYLNSSMQNLPWRGILKD